MSVRQTSRGIVLCLMVLLSSCGDDATQPITEVADTPENRRQEILDSLPDNVRKALEGVASGPIARMEADNRRARGLGAPQPHSDREIGQARLRARGAYAVLLREALADLPQDHAGWSELLKYIKGGIQRKVISPSASELRQIAEIENLARKRRLLADISALESQDHRAPKDNRQLASQLKNLAFIRSDENAPIGELMDLLGRARALSAAAIGRKLADDEWSFYVMGGSARVVLLAKLGEKQRARAALEGLIASLDGEIDTETEAGKAEFGVRLAKCLDGLIVDLTNGAWDDGWVHELKTRQAMERKQGIEALKRIYLGTWKGKSAGPESRDVVLGLRPYGVVGDWEGALQRVGVDESANSGFIILGADVDLDVSVAGTDIKLVVRPTPEGKLVGTYSENAGEKGGHPIELTRN